MIHSFAVRFLRSLVAFIPSKSLLSLRRIKDAPLRFLGLPHEDDFLPLSVLREHDLWVVDVGANRGQSIESFKAVCSNLRITSIEPNPVLASALQKLYPEIDVLAAALGDHNRIVKLHVPRYGYTYWDTRASLDPERASSFLGTHNFLFYRKHKAGLESFDVTVLTLDELGLRPDILKIDAEGLEATILRGGIATLSLKPIIILEAPDENTLEYLAEHGYEAYRAVDKSLVPGVGQLNTFFLNPEAHQDFCAKVVV